MTDNSTGILVITYHFVVCCRKVEYLPSSANGSVSLGLAVLPYVVDSALVDTHGLFKYIDAALKSCTKESVRKIHM